MEIPSPQIAVETKLSRLCFLPPRPANAHHTPETPLMATKSSDAVLLALSWPVSNWPGKYEYRSLVPPSLCLQTPGGPRCASSVHFLSKPLVPAGCRATP